MKRMLYDTVETTSARITKDGYLVAEAVVARSGIQLYHAGELGMDGTPDRIVRVYRPPEEVFAAEAMASYAHRPVTVDHPAELLDASNWKDHAKGQTGDEVLRDGEFVRVPLMLMDKAAIEDWSAGKRELSMGYTMDLEVVTGETPSGEQYDAIQRNLRMNHLALVSRARGGSKLKLGDRKPEDSSMSEVKLSTVTVDGLSVVTTDAGAQAISKLTEDLGKVRAASDAATEAHTTALADKDRELAKRDAEIDTLKGKMLSAKDLDRKVKDRADLITAAKKVADKDYAGMSDMDIRKAAVAAQLGQDAVVDKSDDYILARFDILVDDSNIDGVRKVLRSGDLHKSGDSVDQAHAGMVTNLQDAWKGDKEVAK